MYGARKIAILAVGTESHSSDFIGTICESRPTISCKIGIEKIVCAVLLKKIRIAAEPTTSSSSANTMIWFITGRETERAL